MSGTASRFQTRFAYNPALRSGAYPTAPAAPPIDPSASAPSTASLPGAAITPTAPAQQGVVMSGSMGDNFGNDGGEQGGRNDSRDLGPEPGGMLGGGLSGFGVSNYGTLGGVLGGLAGMALGVPGLGMAASALGTTEDVRSANGLLSNVGLAPSINTGDALLGNATFGMLGRTPLGQVEDVFARDPLAGSVMSAPPSDPFAAAGINPMADVNWAGTTPTTAPQFTTEPEINMVFDPTNAVYAAGGTAAGTAAAGNVWGGGTGDLSAGADSGWGDPGTPGFMQGGYTGAGHDGAVQPAEPAGTVHEGEVVIPAHQVARYGLPALMALVEGTASPSALARLAKG